MNIQNHADDYAKDLLNNHASFRDFGWYAAPEDADQCGIYYYRTRDSRLLEESNADAIVNIMEPFTGCLDDGDDVEIQSHNHWACGWVEGLVIRIKKNGEYTPAFLALVEIFLSLAEYPVLDEDDYSEREHLATLENIKEASGGLLCDDAPEEWECYVCSYLWDTDERELESSDDQGGFPSQEAMAKALSALGLIDMGEFEYCYANNNGIFRWMEQEERDSLYSEVKDLHNTQPIGE